MKIMKKCQKFLKTTNIYFFTFFTVYFIFFAHFKFFIAIFKKKKQDFLNFHNKFIKNIDFLTKKYQLSALLPLG